MSNKSSSEVNSNTDDDHETDQGLTKNGTKRKRRRYTTSLSTRKQQKIEKQALVHSVHPPCYEKCRRKCINFFTEKERSVINKGFWNLNYKITL